MNIKFKGIIDRIDSYTDTQGVKHIRIVDYKSGLHSKMESKIKNNVWVQHTAYAYAMEGDNTKVDSFVYEFPFDQKSGSIEIRGEALTKLEPEVEEFLWSTLGTGEFDSEKRLNDKGDWKKPDLCKYCGYSGICREGIGTQL